MTTLLSGILIKHHADRLPSLLPLGCRFLFEETH